MHTLEKSEMPGFLQGFQENMQAIGFIACTHHYQDRPSTDPAQYGALVMGKEELVQTLLTINARRAQHYWEKRQLATGLSPILPLRPRLLHQLPLKIAEKDPRFSSGDSPSAALAESVRRAVSAFDDPTTRMTVAFWRQRLLHNAEMEQVTSPSNENTAAETALTSVQNSRLARSQAPLRLVKQQVSVLEFFDRDKGPTIA